MKKIVNMYKRYMVRPIIYQTFARFFIGFALALLWDRFMNTEAMLSAGIHAFFTVGIFLSGMAWFHYLRLDGMCIHPLASGEAPGRRKKKHHRADFIDFTDERAGILNELETDELEVCRLSANLLAGAVFLGLSAINAASW